MLGRGIGILMAFSFFSCAKPVAKFSMSTAETTAPAKVNFENQSVEGETYLWDFGDGITSDEASPQHQYFSSGNYTVKLTTQKGNRSSVAEKKVYVKAPLECMVLLETEFGNMLIKLFDSTPKHRDNFSNLVEKAYYDELLFHRVIQGFMIQGGDPRSRNATKGSRLGAGGPGYNVDAEMMDANVHHKGALAAARQPDTVNPKRSSSGSQFYIVHGQKMTDATLDQVENSKGITYTQEQRELYLTNGGTPHLDGDYTVFGQVVEGLDVIDKIAAVQTEKGDRPSKDVKMKIRLIN